MEIFQLCSTLTDIHFGPLGLAPFLAQSSRAWWSIVSSIDLIIRMTPQEWLRLKSMLPYFEMLKSLTLMFNGPHDESSPAIADCEYAGAYPPEKMLPSLDSLTIDITFHETSLGDLALVEEIVSSWPRVKRLSFDVSVFYDVEVLETASAEFFGTRFIREESVAAFEQLEELIINFDPIDGVPEGVPPAVIPCAAWVAPVTLKNLKVLTLTCYTRLNSISFAALVDSTPQLEQFKSSYYLCGLRPADLFVVRFWKRLRTFHLTLDVSDDDLASPPMRGKFVQLCDGAFLPRLVKKWKEELKMLQLVDVSCRVAKDGEYHTLYPLVFGSLCDCGTVHFCVDAESAAAKRFGFS